jgi:hypothetical protein
MACLVEALGMMLPGGAAIPAVHADRLRHGEASGKVAVDLARSALTPDRVMTEHAFESALRVLLAIGGSTNGIIHLTAIAGRLGLRLGLDRLDALSDETPVLVDLKPTGDFYMEDFYRAGGMPVVLQELKRYLHLDTLTVTGETLGQLLDKLYRFPEWQAVIHPADHPLQAAGALVVLKGNLAPDGAILKRSAASPHLLEVKGRAVVFTSLDDLAAFLTLYSYDGPAACQAVKQAGKAGTIKVVAFDAEPETQRCMADGVVQVMIGQRVYFYGYLSGWVMYAMSVLGEKETIKILDPWLVPLGKEGKIHLQTGVDVIKADTFNLYKEYLNSIGIPSQ